MRLPGGFRTPPSILAALCRAALFMLCTGILTSAFCQTVKQGAPASKAVPAPALPFYDWKACPFEGCVYRQWTARKPVTVYDTWKQKRRPVARISVGDSVIGVTGVVITFKPGVIRMDLDLPGQGLKRGDTILTYAYRGEGFSAVWFKGRYYSEFDISFAKWPGGFGCGGAHCAATYVDLGKKVWWAEVKLKSGQAGWVKMNPDDFDGVDLLAKAQVGPVPRRSS